MLCLPPKQALKSSEVVQELIFPSNTARYENEDCNPPAAVLFVLYGQADATAAVPHINLIFPVGL